MMPRLVRTIGVAWPSVTAVLGLCGVLTGVRPATAGNVTWSFGDQVAACPAGDTTNVAGHPSRLRVNVTYNDAAGQPRNLVPPESIWVNVATQSGNVVLNDATKATVPADQWAVYADAPTDSGAARVTLVSMSGCGTLRLRLWVSGVNQGTVFATVRTVDTNADGRVDGADISGACDVNYNGQPDDTALVNAHNNHWHRNALFGTLVQRTNLCETCESSISEGNIGSGDISWSPDGRYVAFSRRDNLTPDQVVGTCMVYYVPSDPADGNVARKFSFPSDPDLMDYDPSWSPLGTVIVWDRADRYLMRKGVYGVDPDTTETVIYDSGCDDCATETSISPDGKLVAFSGATPDGFRIFTVPITGGTPTRITFDPAGPGHHYAKWSPDGSTIVFWKDQAGRGIYTVAATGGISSPFYVPSGAAGDGSFSPDGKLILGGVGPTFPTALPNALDASLPGSPPAIPNYPEYFGSFLPTPTFSADGTRIALLARRPGMTTGSPQVWATRRNMNKPPVITTLAGSALIPATPFVDVTAPATNLYQFTVDAVDPEGDAITYAAFYLRGDLGMSFVPATRTFSWTAPQSEIGNTYNVKFVATTASGGTAYGIARITVGLPYDLVIQNQTFSGTSLQEAINSITAGPAVTVTSTADVTFHVTNATGTGIRLLDGFTAQEGGSFRAYLGSGALGPGLAANTPRGEAAGEEVPVAREDGSSPAVKPATRALEFSLQPNEPNPFDGTTFFRFTIPAMARVRLEIFDVQGRRVSTVTDRSYAPGAYRVAWDRRGDSGARVGAGVYFYRIHAGLHSARRKLVILN
jgi:putative Ig domain-containing protein/WD40 repeat protein